MTNFIFQIIAYFLLWTAVDQGREEKIEPFGKDWFVIFFLIVIAGLLLTQFN